MRLFAGSVRARPAKRSRLARIGLERLEDRTMPTTLVTDFAGLNVGDTLSQSEPPDPIAAAGPSHVVEGVNTTLAIYQKNGTQVFQQELTDFFAPVRTPEGFFDVRFLSDPVVAYDEQAERFIVGILDINTFLGLSITGADFLYAVSDSSDPTADTNGDGRAFSEMHNIGMTEAIAGGDTAFSDYPRIGWNADAHVFTFNMFSTSALTYDHLAVLVIDKATVLDRNASTFSVNHVDRDSSHATMAPATMHGSVSGGPLYFVEETNESLATKTAIRVVTMTNVLGASPTFSDTDLTVNTYTNPPAADQPGGTVETNDARMLNAEWRADHLVAAHAVGITSDTDAHVRWYEFDTSGASPTLLQQGTLDPGPGVDTYFPAIAIAAGGTLGLTYMESSPSEFMSVYVTGRSAGDPPGAMQAPVRAKAGEGTYAGTRAGDYSGITVDPVDGSFWGASEYARTPSNAYWGTWIANFTAGAAVPVHDVAVTALSAPSSVNQGSTVTVNVTVQNQGNASETFDVTLTDTPPAGGAAGTITPATQTVTLAPGASTVVSFSWNTTGASTGSHTLTATASAVPGETDLGDNTLSTTVTVTTPPPVPGMYVWDIVFESRNRGTKHDERVLVTVRRDSDNDGVAEATDAVVQGATVNVQLTGPGSFLRSFSGATNRSGVFRGDWVLDVPNGTYMAEVISLTHSSLPWDRNLDPTVNDTDVDGDNLPDQLHSVPHSSGPGFRRGPDFLPPGQNGGGGPGLPDGLAPAGSDSSVSPSAGAPSAGKPPLQPAGVDSFFAADSREGESAALFPSTPAVPDFVGELLAIDALFAGPPGATWPLA